jgi:hypothetical protein
MPVFTQAGAGLRRPRRGGRERGVRVLPALPDLGPAAGRRLGRPGAESWDAAQDQWGAIQMQNRFIKLNSRRMTALDMQAWTAARMIGEAASRVNSGDPKAVLDFLKARIFPSRHSRASG